MQTKTIVAKATGKNKGQISSKGKPVLAAPGNTAFAALVATQQKQANAAVQQTGKTAATVTMPNAGVAVQQAAKAGFTRTVQNGRGNYTPNSIGALIWQTATALQAVTPNTPIGAAAVRLALPHIKPASISAGLSHWRKFCGTLRVKGQPAKVAPTAPAPKVALGSNVPTVPPGAAAAAFAAAQRRLQQQIIAAAWVP